MIKQSQFIIIQKYPKYADSNVKLKYEYKIILILLDLGV